MTSAADLYRYAATVLRIIDGDTVAASVDLGCRVHWQGSVRCAGFDAPEVHGDTKPAGDRATRYLQAQCPVGSTVYLNSLAFEPNSEQDSFGRMLAIVTLPDGRDLATLMIQSGHAVPYPIPR